MGKLNKYTSPHIPGKSKKGSRSCGYLSYTPSDIEKVAWCLDNGISVSVVPNWDTSRKWMVEIKMNNRVNTDPIDYTDEQALTKMYEYYKYYYDKCHENKI
jgi:hypothetical protein